MQWWNISKYEKYEQMIKRSISDFSSESENPNLTFRLSPILMPYSKNLTVDFATPSSVSDT